MKYNLRLVSTVIILLIIFQACKQKVKEADPNSPALNSNKFVVDESFQPVIDEELYVFRAIYSNLKFDPNVTYAPENKAVNLFLDDSVRVAILSRDLTADEYKVLQARNSHPRIQRFAIDAIALIVNQASNDTTITVSEIKKMLNGDTKQDKSIVFDNPNSGLVRYLKAFAGVNEFKQKNIYALKSNKDVIKYVSEHPNAIGITGFSWLDDPDKDYSDALQKVKIVGVKNDADKSVSSEYFTPSQNTLALKQYPLTRNLYILYKTSKLGMEFAAFITSDRGQRIILRSNLLPDSIPDREIHVRKKMELPQ